MKQTSKSNIRTQAGLERLKQMMTTKIELIASKMETPEGTDSSTMKEQGTNSNITRKTKKENRWMAE